MNTKLILEEALFELCKLLLGFMIPIWQNWSFSNTLMYQAVEISLKISGSCFYLAHNISRAITCLSLAKTVLLCQLTAVISFSEHAHFSAKNLAYQKVKF